MYRAGEAIAFLAIVLGMVALAISHKSEDRIISDAIREARPPFSPDAVVDDFAALLKSYRVGRPIRRRVSARAVPQGWHRV
jgi:hypothetical protein